MSVPTKLLFALRADWRRPVTWFLAAATVLVLVLTLLYYGGWLQYGYRYFLDSVPFVMALCPGGGRLWWDRLGLEGPDRVRDRGDGHRRVLGLQPVSVAGPRDWWRIALVVLAAYGALLSSSSSSGTTRETTTPTGSRRSVWSPANRST